MRCAISRVSAAQRLLQFVLVVFIGINIAFFVTHATPIDPGRADHLGRDLLRQHQPGGDRDDARVACASSTARRASLGQQYVAFWSRVAVGRFRAVAVGFPDAGLGPDRPRAALDGRAADRLHAARLVRSATCSAGSPDTTATTARCAWPASWRWACIRFPTTSSPSCC